MTKLPAVYTKIKTKEKTSKQQKSASELAQQLSNLCLDIYLSGGERFIPFPPFILVRVLPKDLVSQGGIILPNQRQNKPIYEGIVLETYRPYKEEVVLRNTKTRYGVTMECESIGIIDRSCPLKPGDRIAYPHYEGIPHKYLGDDYVLIRQSADQIKFPYCQVLGIIDYKGDRKIGRKITALMQKYYSVTTSGASMSRGAHPEEVAR